MICYSFEGLHLLSRGQTHLYSNNLNCTLCLLVLKDKQGWTWLIPAWEASLKSCLAWPAPSKIMALGKRFLSWREDVPKNFSASFFFFFFCCFLFLKIIYFYGDKASSVVQRMWVHSPDLEDPLEEEMANHSSILAWKIPWIEELGGLQSVESQRVGHD